jgi:peptide/nickel transport system substrate-binding protein
MTMTTRGLWLALTIATAAFTGAHAADEPRRGGTFTYVVETEPPTLDCHAAGTSFVMNLMAQHYSTLLQFDAKDYPHISGDAAESWTVSDDGLTFTFKLRPNIVFHDGSPLTSRDVKATYERLRNPPTGVVSLRKSSFSDIGSIETPDPLTVVFKLSTKNVGMLPVFASPWNCLYSAAKLDSDPTFPSKTVMGTGPFEFVEHVAGSHWLGKRFDRYYRPGQPYFDNIKALFVRGPGVISALSGNQVDGTIYAIGPADQERIRASRGDSVVFQTSMLSVPTLLTFNFKNKLFEDVRVRQAISLAIDRRAGDAALSKISNLKGWGTIALPGSPFATPPEVTEKLLGNEPDIAASRVKARRLLAEAGVPNLKLKMLNRSQRTPYEPLGIFIIDQLRQVGIAVEQTVVDTPQYFAAIGNRDFDVMVDANPSTGEDPVDWLTKYLPGSPNSFAGSEDKAFTEL